MSPCVAQCSHCSSGEQVLCSAGVFVKERKVFQRASEGFRGLPEGFQRNFQTLPSASKGLPRASVDERAPEGPADEERAPEGPAGESPEASSSEAARSEISERPNSLLRSQSSNRVSIPLSGEISKTTP